MGRPKPGGKTCGFCLGAANLPKAVACGYYEGAGFVVLTEPSPWPFALLLCVRCTTRRRGVGELCPQAPRPCALGCVFVSPGASRVPISRRPSALRRGGGGHSSMASGRCVRGAATAHSAVDHTQLGPSRTPPISNSRGTLRRRRAATTPRDALGERSPARATAAAALWFQSQGQRQWALLADNETALQHGCGDDCSRSAPLAALHARPRALH